VAEIEVRRLTQFDLEELIGRCLEECVASGYIQKSQVADSTVTHETIINRVETLKHISKTIIGELLEFEIIRRWAPWEREHKRLDADLQHIVEREAQYRQLLGLRIETDTSSNSSKGAQP
jgi:hypothetical protein